jgi:RHS repeat-associated protein
MRASLVARRSSVWRDALWVRLGPVRGTQNDPNAPTNPMQFASEYQDPTGLYDLRAREYDTSIGRFGAVDPATQPNSLPTSSAYAYALDRPTVLVDPSGRTAQPSAAGTESAVNAVSIGYVHSGFFDPPQGVTGCRSAVFTHHEEAPLLGFVHWCWDRQRITSKSAHFEPGSLSKGYTYVHAITSQQGGEGAPYWKVHTIYMYYSWAQGVAGSDDPWTKELFDLMVRVGGQYSMKAEMDWSIPPMGH